MNQEGFDIARCGVGLLMKRPGLKAVTRGNALAETINGL